MTNDAAAAGLGINCELVTEILTRFIRNEIYRTGFRRAVIGLSGGIDSSVTTYLAVRPWGDMTGNVAVGLDDKLQMNKWLNGLDTPGYVLRFFDLNGGGTVGLDDKLILNKILNGLPIP